MLPVIIGLPYVRISSGQSGFQAHVRIFEMSGYTPANAGREKFFWNREKLRYLRKADVIPPMKENSLFMLFASIVDEKVDEHPYPDPDTS
ncbi:hypothetical protein AVEN_85725-1 [Araneus ventricosus]|uniref:Uncharacterized protein n=1 Tax=Araneus ventricosus TaxID=182803 RepID=A0A4Y2TCM1_ARAVE|nr:hypothetical protein AVEN_85725-1 [Araneus ventricosus]